MTSTHLSVAATPDEGLSGTEDESGHSDVQSVNGADDDEVVEPEDKEPETEEERAKFYQEVRIQQYCETWGSLCRHSL